MAWFQFILNNVSKIKKINWIVKPHPGEKFYGEKITCQQLIKKSDFKNITIWPKKFTNAEVEKYVDYVISARSSSTLEYGINGKKVICSFPSPFSPFKFVNFASGRKKLIHKLNNLEKIRDTNKKELINAHLFSYSFLGDYNLNKYPKYPYGAEKNEIYKKLKNFLNHNQKK